MVGKNGMLGKLFQVLKLIRNLYEIYQKHFTKVIVLKRFTQAAMSNAFRSAKIYQQKFGINAMLK